MGLDAIFAPTIGRCRICGDAGVRVLCAKDILEGICDLCSYTLSHAWRRERGELVSAVSPRTVRTYALVPRLPAGKVAEDVSAYELLVNASGELPHREISTRPSLVMWLKVVHTCATWEPCLRTCYLGYASSGDFSEVVLATAWGRTPGVAAPKSRYATFGELLGRPTPDAGFYLGVKAAFEMLLWRGEQGSETRPPCTVLREPAMRYLVGQAGGEEDDPAMLEVFHSAMSEEELEVARLVGGSGAPKPTEASPSAQVVQREKSAGQGELFGGDKEQDSNELVEQDPNELLQGDGETAEKQCALMIPPGFARPRRDGT